MKINENLELQIQRLADGEVSFADRQSLLNQATRQPELWQAIALAFVENQIWQREIVQLTGDAKSESSIDSQATNDAGSKISAAGWWRSGRQVWTALAMAASLLLLLGVYNWGLVRGNQLAVAQINGQSVIANASHVPQQVPDSLAPDSIAPDSEQFARGDDNPPLPDRIADMRTADSRPSIRAPYGVTLVSDDGRPLVDGQIPVIPYTMAREMGLQFEPKSVPENLQNYMRTQGYNIRPNLIYISGQLQDGREITVPLQNLVLESYGQ